MPIRKKTKLVVGYLVFLLLLFEGTARLLFVIPAFSNRLQADEDYSWRRNWMSRHTKDVTIYFTFDILDPTTGWLTRPNIKDLKVFGSKILNTNSRGVRGTAEHAYSKDPHTPRLLILGDSFTFGRGE